MSTASLKRCLVLVVLGAGICFLFANRAATSTTTQAHAAGINELAAFMPGLPLPTSGSPAQEKNPVIAELEKKIAGQETKPAEEVFKNIKIFKGRPAMQVLRVMELAFSPALGVNCSHCHVPGEWEKDDKEAKQTARKMWVFQAQVTQQLKEQIGKGTVNCTTCHRGQVKPALNLPPK